jgi:hypothetical protein
MAGGRQVDWYLDEVIEEFGYSAWSSVGLGSEWEMSTSIETYLSP